MIQEGHIFIELAKMKIKNLGIFQASCVENHLVSKKNNLVKNHLITRELQQYYVG